MRRKIVMSSRACTAISWTIGWSSPRKPVLNRTDDCTSEYATSRALCLIESFSETLFVMRYIAAAILSARAYARPDDILCPKGLTLVSFANIAMSLLSPCPCMSLLLSIHSSVGALYVRSISASIGCANGCLELRIFPYSLASSMHSRGII